MRSYALKPANGRTEPTQSLFRPPSSPCMHFAPASEIIMSVGTNRPQRSISAGAAEATDEEKR